MCAVLSRVWFFVTPWTVACQAALSMGFSRQEYWSGQPIPSPGNLPYLGIETVSSIGRRILYCWAIWETQGSSQLVVINELKFYWQSQILFFSFLATGDWGILVPWDQWSNPGPWQWKSRDLTTRPLSNSLKEPNSYEDFGRGVVLKITLRVGFLKLVLAIVRLIWSVFV